MDRPILTAKQNDILHYLYRFRFLTSTQIQKLLNDKTTRLTNYYLKTLNSQNYIGKLYTRKLGEGNQPAIYYLAPGSIKALQDDQKKNFKYIYREKLRSKQFITRVLYIADYFLFLLNESEKSDFKILFFTKMDLQSHPYIIHPLPDAYFAKVDNLGETKRYFVEVIDEGVPRFAQRLRIDQYNNYLESQKFETTTNHTFPTILFICPNTASKFYLNRYLVKMIEESSLDSISIYLATKLEAFSGHWEKVETINE